MPSVRLLPGTPVQENSFILSCLYDEQFQRDITEDIAYNHDHMTVWKVRVNSFDKDGAAILKELRRLKSGGLSPGPKWDTPPALRDYYSPLFAGSNESKCFCFKIACEVIDVEDSSQWRVTAWYGPPQDIGSNLIWSQYMPSDPFQWYWLPDGTGVQANGTIGGYVRNAWIEYVEDQKVLENATCITQLPGINRGPGSGNEPGPICNATGQQTIDPQVEPVHRVILNVVVNYPSYTYAMGMNDRFSRGIHAPSIMFTDSAVADPIVAHQYDTSDQPLFMGFPHGCWKFLIADVGRPQYRMVRTTTGSGYNIVEADSVVEYCPVTIRLELNLGEIISTDQYDVDYWSGWLRQILNNGQVCLKKWNDGYVTTPDPMSDDDKESYIPSPLPPHDPQIFPVLVKKLKENAADSEGTGVEDDDARSSPSSARELLMDQLKDVEPSEPINLRLDGTQITDPSEKPNHILFNNLRPVDLYDITDAYGRRIFPLTVTIPSYPLPVSAPPTEPAPTGGSS